MSRVVVKRHLGPADVAVASALLDAAYAHDGRPPFGERQWHDLIDGGLHDVTGVFAYTADREPIAYAQVSHDDRGHAVEYAVHPGWRATGADAEVVQAAVGAVAEHGGGQVQLWRSHPTPASDGLAAAAGLHAIRDLLQLRRPLPVGEPWELEVRPFVPGRDEEAWLEVNNRAFAWHPEQGGWDLATLKGREAMPWFDPAGFLLHERNGRLAGFCWTKVHDASMGEIYVIAVDPDFAGLGLGRALTLAGLDHLAGRGMTIGMLYVDATNESARALYDRLGFTLDHIDREYTGDVAAVPGAVSGAVPGVSARSLHPPRR